MMLVKEKSDLWLDTIHKRDEPILHKLVAWLNDPEVVRYSEQRHKQHTLDSQWDYIESFKGDDVYWGVFNKNALIGTTSYRIDKPNNVANVGIMIGDKSYWNKGFGYDAWRRTCDYVLWKGARKVEAGCMATNHAMMNICMKYGMVEEGRMSEHFLFEGRTTDLINFGKFNETDDAGRAA